MHHLTSLEWLLCPEEASPGLAGWPLGLCDTSELPEALLFKPGIPEFLVIVSAKIFVFFSVTNLWRKGLLEILFKEE